MTEQRLTVRQPLITVQDKFTPHLPSEETRKKYASVNAAAIELALSLEKAYENLERFQAMAFSSCADPYYQEAVMDIIAPLFDTLGHEKYVIMLFQAKAIVNLGLTMDSLKAERLSAQKSYSDNEAGGWY